MRTNFILVLISLEILLLSLGLLFSSFSFYWMNDPDGQIYSFFLVMVSAADSVIALSLLSILKRKKVILTYYFQI